MTPEEGNAGPPKKEKGGGSKKMLIAISAVAVVVILIVVALVSLGSPQGDDNDNGVPSAPQDLRLIALDDYVVARWNSSESNGGSNVTSYKVHCTAGDPVNCSRNWTVDARWPGLLHIQSNELNLGWTYHFYVVSINANGEGQKCNEVTFTAYFRPSMIEIKNHEWGSTYVNLSWSPPYSDGGKPVTGYKVQRTIWNGQQSAPVNFSVGPADCCLNDSSVVSGVTYEYVVGAVNEIGCGQGYSKRVIPGAPGKVEDVIYLPGDGYINLIWAPPKCDGGSPIVKYEISRYTQGEYHIPQFVTNVSASTESFNDTSLTNGDGYIYKVIAFNGLAGRGNDFDYGGLIITPSPSAARIWPYPAIDFSVGDYTYYETTLGPSYGGGLAWKMTYVVTRASSLTVTLNSTEICVALNNWTFYDDEFCLQEGLFGANLNDAQFVGSEVISTNWGSMTTDHWTTSDSWGATFEIWIHDGILIKQQTYTSGQELTAEKVLMDTNLEQIIGP